MARKLTLRQLLVWILSLYYDLSQKEIEVLAGLPDKSLSQYLRRGEIKDGLFERLMTAMRCKPAAIRIVTACLEALDGLEAEDGLSDEDRAQIELAVLEVGRMMREELTAAGHATCRSKATLNSPTWLPHAGRPVSSGRR